MPTIAESTQKLADLVAKVNAFVNGPATQVIQTDNGQLKTLAGAIKALESIDYVQKIHDFNTVSELVASSVELGELGRVNLDLDSPNNGIYQKQEAGWVKVSYEALYDLQDKLPNPWNNVEKMFDEVDIAGPIKVASGFIPVSNSSTASSVFRARLEYNLDTGGVTFAYHSDMFVSVFAKAAGVFGSQVNVLGANSFSPGSYTPGTLPTLRVVHSNVGTDHFFEVFLDPAKDGSTVRAGNGRLILENIDLSVFDTF